MWRVIPGQLAEHRCWDAQYVVYNNLSGDTHLLGQHAMHVLLRLQHGGAADSAMLATSLRAMLDAGATASDPANVADMTDMTEVAAAVDGIVEDLRRQSLIAQCGRRHGRHADPARQLRQAGETAGGDAEGGAAC